MEILAARGVSVVDDGRHACLRGDPAVITPALRRVIARHRDALLALAGFVLPPPPPETVVPPGESGEGEAPAETVDVPPDPNVCPVHGTRLREFKWRSGRVWREEEAHEWRGEPGMWPGTAWWWRYAGDERWEPIGTRQADAMREEMCR